MSALETAPATAAPAQALRCRCSRPCEIVIDDECRCLKCGRRPAIRLDAGEGTAGQEREL